MKICCSVPVYVSRARAARLCAARASRRMAPKDIGTVDFATSCNPATKTKFNEAVALLHSFWFAESRADLRERPQGRSELRHRVLGHRAHALGESVRGPAAAADDCQRQGRHRQGPRHGHADRAREGLHRRRGHPVQQRRCDHAAAARPRLRARHRPPLDRQQGRCRGAHLLGARRGPGRLADRQDLCASVAGRRNARADVAKTAEPPWPRALHHSCV